MSAPIVEQIRSPDARGARRQEPIPGTLVAGGPRPVGRSRQNAQRTIWAVIPCFNRIDDLRLVAEDLRNLDRSAGLGQLHVLIIDNASAVPIRLLDVAPGLHDPSIIFEVVRLETNTGGSGGFNFGLALAIRRSTSPDDLLWLIDSDARLDRGALAALLAALDADAALPAAGSALHDPETREVFELGGSVDRRTGELVQLLPCPLPASPVEVQYLAACSLLVRRWAAEGAGLMSDLFLNGDDAEWCLRLADVSGRRPVAVPASIAFHPRPDRMRTWPRFFSARNAFAVLARLHAQGAGGGAWVRTRRALRETARALSMVMIGRDELASLHMRGLRDASRGRFGPCPDVREGLAVERPLASLVDEVRARRSAPAIGGSLGDPMREYVASMLALAGLTYTAITPQGAPQGSSFIRALARWIGGMTPDVAIVSARGRPADWLAARTLISISEGPTPTFTVQEIAPLDRLWRSARVLAQGAASALRLAMRVRQAPVIASPPPEGRPDYGSLSIVVLAFNRWAALEATLRAIASLDLAGLRSEVIVVDNASTDGTAERLRALFPDVRLIALERNVGVEGFNIGVREAAGDLVLILDDDSWPDPPSLRSAIQCLGARDDLDAVALHPRHPTSHASEWAFAERHEPTDAWPFMGCGNLVRREAWLRVGGYEPSYFLYRNDTDLALKLLADHASRRGRMDGVHFDPAWVVWHDSPAAARKSRRWFQLATRNWLWMCRRHGRGITKWKAMAAGWVRAHQLAGLSLRDQWAVVKGTASGVMRRAPRCSTSRGQHEEFALTRLLQVRRGTK